MTPTPPRPPAWLLYTVSATGVAANTLVVPATPDILDGLNAARSLAGVLVAAPTVPGVVLAPVIGLLADRFGRREVLVPCLVIYAVAGALGAAAPTFWTLIASRLLQGVGAAGLINLAVVLIGDHWEGTERARMMGRNAAVLTVFVVLFPLLGGAMTDVWGWRAPFLVYAASLATAVLAARGVPRSTTRGVALRAQVRQTLPYLRAPATIALLSAGLLMFVVLFAALLTVLPLYAEDRFGLGAAARGVLVGLPSVTSTIGSLILGRVQQQVGIRWLVIGSASLFALSPALMAWAPGLVSLGVVLLVFGFGQGLLIPALQSEMTELGSTQVRGTLVAVWVAAVRLGQTIGPLAASVGLGTVGAPATLAACGAIGLLVVGTLIPRRLHPGQDLD